MPSNHLDEVLKQIKKKYGCAVIKGSEIQMEALSRVSTGSLALDIETGGGIPFGKIIEFFGREQSGKTTLALKTAANVQKLGKRVVWIDAESAFDPQWAKALGVDVASLDLIKPTTGEEAVDALEAVVRSGECGMVVLDSVAALMPSLELEKSMADDPEKIGTRALLVNRVCRRLYSALNTYDEESQWNNCAILLINQIRNKVGVIYGSPETTTGGEGIKFASSIRVRFAKGEWVEGELYPNGDKAKIGYTVRFRTEKNKTFPPFRESEFIFYFAGQKKGQIDTTEELVRYGKLFNLVTLSGSMYKYESIKASGKEAFAAVLLQDGGKLAEKLQSEILELARR